MSERRIFDSLKNDPGTESWIGLHSLGLSETRRGPYGEIDMVVLIPNKGIVCLEIKGGQVSCKDGIWTTRNQKTGQIHQIKTSPYLQAREGMFALKKAVEKQFGQLDPASACPFFYAVVFPSVIRPPQTPGEDPWETIDMENLRAPISASILRNVDQTRKKSGFKHRPETVAVATLHKIKKYLRPDFERVITRSSTIRQSEERIAQLTDGQLDFLDTVEVNPRVVLEGAAGTGKTVLAIEYARRCAAQNQSVILLCYNRLLASWLQKQFSATEKENISVVSFNHYLLGIIEEAGLAADLRDAAVGVSTAEMYDELVPFYAEMALTEIGIQADLLILDEAQDLIRSNNMPVLNLLVSGGLVNGRWAIFGDFTSQAIYNQNTASEEIGPIDQLRLYSDNITTVPLRVNCRNTKPIGEETALLSGFESLPYRLAQASGLPVDYRYWKTAEQERTLLQSVLQQLLDDGVPAEDIVILAPVKFDKSAAASIGPVNKIPVASHRDIKGEPGHCIVFSTIHAFKGMESSVVIVCGFTEFTSERSRSLLYTGMSRARSHLVLLAHEKLKSTLSDMTRRQLTQGLGS